MKISLSHLCICPFGNCDFFFTNQPEMSSIWQRCILAKGKGFQIRAKLQKTVGHFGKSLKFHDILFGHKFKLLLHRTCLVYYVTIVGSYSVLYLL